MEAFSSWRPFNGAAGKGFCYVFAIRELYFVKGTCACSFLSFVVRKIEIKCFSNCLLSGFLLHELIGWLLIR